MPTLLTKTAEQSRDDMRRVLSNGYKQRGVATPNVDKGTDDYLWASAVGNEQEAAYANLATAADQLMPDSATGADLDRILAIYGLTRRPAGPSTGYITFATTLTTGVTSGTQLQDPNGNPIQVTTGGVYNNGDLIPVASIGVGSGTNLAGGSRLTWVTQPTYAAPTALLTSAGMSGGIDAEDDETARRRLFDYLRNPPGNGNSAELNQAAEASSPSIQKSFAYPACNGPGTMHVAVAGYATASTSRARAVSATVAAAAASALSAAEPEVTEIVCTSVADQRADVSFQMLLPAAITAIPSGTGGGWIDANPWPSVAGITASRIYCSTISVTNNASFRVESMTAPTIGASICWVDTNYLVLHTATVVTSSTAVAPSGGTPGQYDITISAPFADQAGNAIAVGDYVFPAAVKTQTYITAILNTFAALGPGEKTASAGLLPHAYRQPRYFASWDYHLDGQFTRALSSAGAEVLDVEWGYQNGGVVVPTLPATITSAANIFSPRRIALYPE